MLAKLLAAYEQIKPLVPYPAYCVDFGVFADGKVRVIELNPFGDHTGACNFSWKKGPAERRLLTDGPLEFRLTKGIFPDARQRFLVGYWDKWMASFRCAELQKRARIRHARQALVIAAVVLGIGFAIEYSRRAIRK